MNAVNVVGAGIAGSLVARLLRQAGMEVRVIDDQDRYSASNASSNLFIASWLKKFSSEAAGNGIRIVEELFGDKIDKPFSGGIAAAGNVKHIAQSHILVEPDVLGTVTHVDEMGTSLADFSHFEGPTVVCTGWRLPVLFPEMKDHMFVKVGHCFLFAGTLSPGQSKLSLVSPYTHQKLYQFAPGQIYYADSVAIKGIDKYEKRREELYNKTLKRAQGLVGELPILEHRVGYRPFVSGHDFGYCSEQRPNVWVINGGGKNGIVAYADAAEKVTKAIKDRFQ